MITDEMIQTGADALRGLRVKDDKGWGWGLDKSEREDAARRVLTAALPTKGDEA